MKKPVLLLVQNLPIPQDRRVWLEATTLQENNYQVSVISPGNPDQPRFEMIDGVSVYRYPRPPKASGYFSYLWEYAYSFCATLYLTIKIYFRRGFAVIHTANPPDFFFLLAWPFKLLGVKFVYDQHDLMPEMLLCRFHKDKNHLLYKILLCLERLSYRTADAHIATCQSGQEKTLSRVKAEPKNFIVRSSPNPAHINRELIDQEIAAELKKRFAYLGVYLGVMGPQDGVDKLLESIRVIIHEDKRTDIGFALLGDGDDFERLKKLAAEYQIENNVIFTGWADAETVSTYFFSAQVGLMPEPKNDYTDNSLHNKVLEYMMAGLPIVSYDLKEARISADQAAIFVPDNDEAAFAREILVLIDNEEKRNFMGKFGQERVQSLFAQAESKKALLAVYDFLAELKK